MKNKLIETFSGSPSQLQLSLIKRKYRGEEDFDQFVIFVQKTIKKLTQLLQKTRLSNI